jgi:hypothetical protein
MSNVTGVNAFVAVLFLYVFLRMYKDVFVDYGSSLGVMD